MQRISIVFAAFALWAGTASAQIVVPAEGLPPELAQQLQQQYGKRMPLPPNAVEMPVPLDLFKTTEDRKAWGELAEIIREYNDIYHRQPTGVEMVDALERGLGNFDPHSDIYEPDEGKELRDQINGQFGGVGMEIMLSSGDDKSPKGIKVLPLAGQPADKAGVKAKDIIVQICNWDDQPNPKISVIFDANGKEKTPPKCQETTHMSQREAVKLLKGLPDTAVRVLIWRAGAEGPLTFDIHRDVVKINPVKDIKVKNGYGSLQLTTFSEEAVRDVLDALHKLKAQNQGKPLDGLVLDLRGNTGGLVDQALILLAHFLNDAQYQGNSEAAIVLSEEKRGGITPIANAIGARDELHGAPIVILVNGGSASASEIVAGVLQLHGRATIAGVEHSFGKGSIQQIRTLTSGKVLRLTTAQYLIGSRGCEKPIQGIGVKPDIFLKPQQGELLAVGAEKDLAHSIPTSTISDAKCTYHFKVSPEHRAKALEMLKTFGFELSETAKTQ